MMFQREKKTRMKLAIIEQEGATHITYDKERPITVDINLM